MASKKTKQIRIKKFDPSSIPDDSVCVFIGKRRSGKSFCIREILYWKRDIPIGQIVSGSEKGSQSLDNAQIT